MARHAIANPPWTCDCPCHNERMDDYLNPEYEKMGEDNHLNPKYPHNLLNEMEEKLNYISKYNLLRQGYIHLAQALHDIGNVCGLHAGDDFRFCRDKTCKIMVQTLENTKI